MQVGLFLPAEIVQLVLAKYCRIGPFVLGLSAHRACQPSY
jgi:hypothetical protein